MTTLFFTTEGRVIFFGVEFPPKKRGKFLTHVGKFSGKKMNFLGIDFLRDSIFQMFFINNIHFFQKISSPPHKLMQKLWSVPWFVTSKLRI